jgi:hypothetical protein
MIVVGFKAVVVEGGILQLYLLPLAGLLLLVGEVEEVLV